MYVPDPPNARLAPSAVSAASGGSQPHANIQPYVALNFITSLFGTFPPQS